MANFKNKRPKWSRRIPLILKYRHRGMAKTNYRNIHKRNKAEK